MTTENLWLYVNFTNLLNKLAYLYTAEIKYKVTFDLKNSNVLEIFYDKEKKWYNYSFSIQDDKINTLFLSAEKKIFEDKIKTKAKFIKILKNKIDSLIDILQKNWHNFNYKPEVGLFDLEMLSQEIDELNKNEPIKEKEKQDLKKNKKILNQVLIYHEISSQHLINEPHLSENNYILKIGSIDNDNLDLFPKQDKYFSNVSLEATSVPNIYFPWIIIIKIEKTFTFKNINFTIKYTWQELSKDIWLIAKKYYDDYKINADDRLLHFWLRLVEIIKNPYNKNNLTRKTSEQIMIDSNCQKCWSSSSLFNVKLSNVNIKTVMGKFETSTLFPKNIINHKDILTISCKECNNTILNNKELINNIEKRRQYLDTENWISHKTWKPLLDSDCEEVVVKYDIINVDVEFDMTNPMLPKISYEKIVSVWRLIGWSDILMKRSKTFYDR